MSNTMDQKCPNCRAPLKYSAKTKKWDCEYCGSHLTLEDLKKNRENKEKKQDIKKTSNGYTCKNCGAQIIVSDNTTATSCVYCRSTALMMDRLQEEYTPNSIIPFKKTKEDAIKAFQSYGLRNFLAPKEFNKKENINEIQGIYIPFWLFDFNLDIKITGTGKKISHWTSGNYSYTKTDTYSYERSGVFPFFDIPVDGSKYFDNALMNSIEPFDYKDLVEFDGAYLSGFLAEKYDLSKEEVQNIAIDRAVGTSTSELAKSLNNYNAHSITKTDKQAKDLSGEYVLLPVWLLNIKYKDKIYPYAYNGQTGKMIGDLPISKIKVAVFFIILFIVSVLVISLGMILIGGYTL